jgi:steroid 5-alpha reductase family enzyme
MQVLFQNYLNLGAIVFVYMSLWFFVSLVKKRNDVADIAWGLGFLLIAIVSFFFNGVFLDRGFLVTLLVVFWALRLSLHIFIRSRGKSEDYRYKKWRDEWGKFFYIRSFFQVYILQGALMLVVASPVVIVNIYRGGNLGWLDFLGIIIWLVGFFFESVGDWQLSRFIQNPANKGKIIQTGLWQYSRHPNYFGEVAQWWGIWLIALSVPYGALGIIGPLTIALLVVWVSGIPLLEKKLEGKPEFREYKKRVSVFFPLPPKQ